MLEACLHSLLRAGRELLFPRVCVHCGEAVESESGFAHLCVACGRAVQRIRGPVCPICGHPYHGPDELLFECTHCAGLEAVFGSGRSMVMLLGPARSLVHELKYHGGLQVLEDMGCLAREDLSLQAWARDAVLVPVPMHPRKRRHRGYNQTELLTQVLLASGVGRSEARLLERRADGGSQTVLNRGARLANLENAFEYCGDSSLPRSTRLILIDDVFTTGSTLNHCARVLHDRGFHNIDVLTFGHG